jgi:hypothetical protein
MRICNLILFSAYNDMDLENEKTFDRDREKTDRVLIQKMYLILKLGRMLT